MELYIKMNWENIGKRLGKMLGIVIIFIRSKAIQNSKVRPRKSVVPLKIRCFFNSDSSLHVLTGQRRSLP